MCGAAQPKGISKGESFVILIINIFLPGVGTIFASFLGNKCKCSTFLLGCLQALLAPLIIGWVWAICWSLKLRRRIGRGERDVKDASSRQEDPEQGVAPPPAAYSNTPSSKSHSSHKSKSSKHSKHSHKHSNHHSGHQGHSTHSHPHSKHSHHHDNHHHKPQVPPAPHPPQGAPPVPQPPPSYPPGTVPAYPTPSAPPQGQYQY